MRRTCKTGDAEPETQNYRCRTCYAGPDTQNMLCRTLHAELCTCYDIRVVVYTEIWICCLEYAFAADVYGRQSGVDGDGFCCCRRVAGSPGAVRENP